MPEMPIIHGFSRLSRREKLAWLQKQVHLTQSALEQIETHLHPRTEIQEIYEELSENTVTNFFLPLGLAPNFLINDQLLTIPMVIEESSVVAAAAHAAKFWAMHGGFHTRVVGTTKVGQVHFTWSGSLEKLQDIFHQNKDRLVRSVKSITGRMEERGGGLDSLELISTGPLMPGHYHLLVTFNTADAMGANFINSVLERLASQMAHIMEHSGPGEFEIILSILSNYTPQCLVECYLEGEIKIFEGISPHLPGDQFAKKFQKAVDIAVYDPYRAVTHNKGIFNGMDAVIMATGNDFRAVEACGHAYASRDGKYKSLSWVELSEGSFRFTLEVPVAVGTVGGLTGIHPMAEVSLEILGRPSAKELMQVIAAAGLANNFSAVRSLITTGIQQGHMKMHLGNILRHLKATREETERAVLHFSNRIVSYNEVVLFLDTLRDQNH